MERKRFLKLLMLRHQKKKKMLFNFKMGSTSIGSNSKSAKLCFNTFCWSAIGKQTFGPPRHYPKRISIRQSSLWPVMHQLMAPSPYTTTLLWPPPCISIRNFPLRSYASSAKYNKNQIKTAIFTLNFVFKANTISLSSHLWSAL